MKSRYLRTTSSEHVSEATVISYYNEDEPMVNEDNLPPRRVPVHKEAPEPDYRDAPEPYRGEYEYDELELPEYED